MTYLAAVLLCLPLGMLANRLRTHGWRVLLTLAVLRLLRCWVALASFLGRWLDTSRLVEPLYAARELPVHGLVDADRDRGDGEQAGERQPVPPLL